MFDLHKITLTKGLFGDDGASKYVMGIAQKYIQILDL